MKSWPTKKLGEMCEIISPGIKKFEGSKKYVATADVDFDKILDFTEITYKNRPSRANIEVKENDALVARMAETKKFLMADKNFQDNYIFSTGFAVLRAKDELIPKYLFYFLTTKDFNLQKDKLAVGATQKAINNPALKKIKIPVPPLPIQQKIVERLDAIKKAQELNDKQIELAEELFQSLLHRELDPKGKNWEIRKLRDVIDLIESGSRPKGGAVSSGIPSLGVEHINENGGFNIDKIKYIPSDFFKNIKRGKIKKQDVLIAKDGATTGKIAIVDNDFPFDEAAVNEHLFIIRGNSKIISQKFLFFTLFGSKGKTQILKTKHGAAQGGIDQSFVNFVKIPLLPLETQKKIVEKLSAVQEYKKKLLDQKQKLQELFESVLNKSFKGELI